MRNRWKLAAFLGVALLGSQVLQGGTQGGVKGRVAIDLKGVEGIPITLVNVTTGKSFTVRTARDGAFSISLPNGSYVVSSPGLSGLSIGRAPVLIQVSSGKFASANIELARSLLQEGPGGQLVIFHNPIGCVAQNEFPVFDIAFQPAGLVVSARLYFKSNLSDEWFYVDFQALSGDFPKYKWTMAPDPANPGAMQEGVDIVRRFGAQGEPEPVSPGVPPTHRAFLPKVNPGAGITEVTYYIQVTLSDFTETRTIEIPIRVLSGGQACRSGLFAAPGGAPQGLSVLTAGGAAGAPAGFGGIGLGIGTGVLGAGAGLVPLVVAETTAGGGSPTPTPTPEPTPAPTPTPTPTPTPPGATPIPTPTPAPPAPTPTPTPTPTPRLCTVLVTVDPPGLCQAKVTGGPNITISTSQSFDVPCAATVRIDAVLAPSASFPYPGPAASWSGTACSGDAIGKPCVISPILPDLSTVVLGCGCDPKVFGFASTCGFSTPVPLRP